MRIAKKTKALAIMAGLSAVAITAQAKLVKPNTYTTNVVVGKVFYAGAKDNNGKNYLNSKYIELYNNSADTLDVAGMMVALVESEAKANAWTTDKMAEAHKDSVAVKQIFRLPAGSTMDPYTSLVIANSAIDHSPNGEGFPDLSQADFEAKDASGKTANNDAVAAIELVYSCYPSISNMNLVQGGPCAVVLLTEDTKTDDMPLVFSPGKDKGNQFMLVPKSKVIDGVEIVKMSEEDILRLDNSIDSGYVAITAKTGYTGEAVYRKTAFVVGSQKVLFDTNDSSLDFGVSTDMSPRLYDAEASGLTPMAITIPESGFLPINIDRPFCGPRNMTLCYVSANTKSSDLRYNEFRGDSTLLMKGDWIAVAMPGTYDLQLSSSQGVMKMRSTSQQWTDESHREFNGGQKTRRIYKFSNVKGHVGFQRDENYADVKWNTADFAEGEHIYITLTDAIGNAIFEANGASSYDELSFIPWHGTMPEDVAAQGISSMQDEKHLTSPATFDLQGRRTAATQLRPGLYIKDGKKMIIK